LDQGVERGLMKFVKLLRVHPELRSGTDPPDVAPNTAKVVEIALWFREMTAAGGDGA
jgi:hypothetical protein